MNTYNSCCLSGLESKAPNIDCLINGQIIRDVTHRLLKSDFKASFASYEPSALGNRLDTPILAQSQLAILARQD